MHLTNYKPQDPDIWRGRIDGTDPASQRWHQILRYVDLRETPTVDKCFVILGFAVDEGVKRNRGRTGAAAGPSALRRTMANLPAGGYSDGVIVDAGTIFCMDGNLELAQQELAKCVEYIISAGGFPIILGGGHEITYGHYQGIRRTSKKKIGVLNFDAHFDLREPEPLGSSGTGFYQIARDEQHVEGFFHYLVIGIQVIGNTTLLFNRAKNFGVRWLEGENFHLANKKHVSEVIRAFLAEIDHLYVTVDMDVFAAAYAPGVSAPAYNGIVPDSFFMQVFDQIINDQKLISIDIAELNPKFDIDMRTARLAAHFIFRLIQHRSKGDGIIGTKNG